MVLAQLSHNYITLLTCGAEDIVKNLCCFVHRLSPTRGGLGGAKVGFSVLSEGRMSVKSRA